MLSKTKEPKKKRQGVCQERIGTSVLEAPSPVRAALLSALNQSTVRFKALVQSYG